ncbi:outer membrane protein assembly factor BamC [Alcanivorax sp.]|uniref:outer membrane protein assembly factor BamC n=1 Tax=Alcanivorax sp. TaxID=1872427 RepID=UPI0025BEE03B|nr:outer membrane protein assembly factor BamC [Alcanivorax sp.]
MKQVETTPLRRFSILRGRLPGSLAVLAVISGCSWLPNSSLEYRDAAVTDPIQVPEGGVFIGEQALYDVPRQDDRLIGKGPDEDKYEPPTPPELVVLGNVPEDDEDLPAPSGESARAILARDGNGYPILMMSTRYAWAWEYIGDALKDTDLKVSDRDREIGVFYLRVPSRYELGAREAQLKLSHTTNGIQVAVLNEKGTALVEKAPGQAILERIYEELE